MRFKEGAEVVIVFLSDRIKFVVMAPGTLECEPQKCLTGLFDRFKHPDIAVELVPVATEKSGGPQDIRISREPVHRQPASPPPCDHRVCPH